MRNNNYQELQAENARLTEQVCSLTQRYIEAERFIMETQDRSVIDRIFLLPDEIREFLRQRLIKYTY